MLATEAEVRALCLPSHVRPEGRFYPLTHSTVLDRVDAALRRASLFVDSNSAGSRQKKFTLASNGAKLYATMVLDSEIMPGVKMMIGIRNSWDKSLSLAIGFGSHVLVCSNGAFCAEKVLRRKHTTTILEDIDQMLDETLAKTKAYQDQQAAFFRRLEAYPMTNAYVNDFIVRSAMPPYEVITKGEILDVVQEWLKPSHVEFESRTAWSLFNAFTSIGKETGNNNGIVHAERTIRLTSFFAKEVGSTAFDASTN